MVIELAHTSDPRFLLVDVLPERVTLEDLRSWRYGKALLASPAELVTAVYAQPDGPGTDWLRPDLVDCDACRQAGADAGAVPLSE